MNNSTFVHKYLKSLIHPNDLCVDMTLGNGNDALFFCQCGARVIGFDICSQAIDRSRQRLENYPVLCILDSHENVDSYIHEKVRLFIFNLGYLPNSSSSIITQAASTAIALEKAYSLLEEGGYLVVSFYRGHPGGKEEYYRCLCLIQEKDWNILEIFQKGEQVDEPITYIIKKAS